MAFRATLEMDDSMNRTVSKSLECEATVLATAITDVAALLTDLEAISDLGVVKVSYSSKDTSGAFDENDPSNVDTGATFRLRTTLGEVVSYKIPGFKQSLADGNGQIDPAGAEADAYFATFLAAGAFTLSKGLPFSSVNAPCISYRTSRPWTPHSAIVMTPPF